MLRTSVIACTIHKSTFSAQFRIFYVKMEIWYKIFQKNRIQPPYGVLPICKLLFPNGSYRNGVCRALWALSANKNPFSSCRIFHMIRAKRPNCLNAGYRDIPFLMAFNKTKNVIRQNERFFSFNGYLKNVAQICWNHLKFQ